MIWIRHRCNSFADLQGLDPAEGVEIDLRADPSVPGRIYLAHDPWTAGVDFAEWLPRYRDAGCSGPLILNTKEDGLEDRVLDLLRLNGVTNFFFLDTAFPTLIRRSGTGEGRSGEKHYAVRISLYEPVLPELFDSVAAEWAWVDCFGAQPLLMEFLQTLPERIRVCLVSPELQGGGRELLENFRHLLPRASAICTKDPNAWRRHFSLRDR